MINMIMYNVSIYTYIQIYMNYLRTRVKQYFMGTANILGATNIFAIPIKSCFIARGYVTNFLAHLYVILIARGRPYKGFSIFENKSSSGFLSKYSRDFIWCYRASNLRIENKDYPKATL